MAEPSTQLLEYIDIVRKMPAPKVRRIFLPYDDTHLTCECGKRRSKASMPERNSGVVKFRDTVCQGCPVQKEMRKVATVVCAKCHEVVTRCTPGQDPKDRFTFEAGAIYHVLYCDICSPGLQATELIERIIWRRNNNIPNPLKT